MDDWSDTSFWEIRKVLQISTIHLFKIVWDIEVFELLRLDFVLPLQDSLVHSAYVLPDIISGTVLLVFRQLIP